MGDNAETAVLAGGCFWIMQQLLRQRDGVVSTRVGWAGGQNDNPTAENNSGHAEAVEVVFDPEQISYRDLLEYFFQTHRPDLGEQLVGSSYRSEIFYTTDEQRKVAEETIPDVDASGHWPGKVVTEISQAGPFWEAEAEDQDYFQRYPEAARPPSRGSVWKLPTARPRPSCSGVECKRPASSRPLASRLPDPAHFACVATTATWSRVEPVVQSSLSPSNSRVMV